MSHTTNVPARKSLKSKLIVAEHVIILTVIVAGAGFWLGTQYEHRQVAQTKAAVQDALKASATPPPATQASK